MIDSIIGHQEIREKLLSRYLDDKLHSALLLNGIQGIGKKLIGTELAKRMLCEGPSGLYPCNQCRSCTSFTVNNHPDFFNVECENKDQWNIEAIRELLYNLSLRSFQGKGKVVLFTDIEQLSLACHNVLLKSLEEPSESVRFILTTSNVSKLPITIRSRCQNWNISPLTQEEVLQVLMMKNLISIEDKKEFNTGLLADGSVAIFSAFSQHVDKWHEVRDLLIQIGDGSAQAFSEAASAWGKDKELLKVILHFMRITSKEMLVEKQSHEELARWSVFLSNVLSAERLIFDRNISALLVLQRILSLLLPSEMIKSSLRLNSNTVLIEHSF